MTILAHVEMTDTFGREPNYAWVQRHTLRFPDGTPTVSIVKRAKRELSMQRVPCQRLEYGDTIELRPKGWARVIFIEITNAQI
jgi:hypothetical protein